MLRPDQCVCRCVECVRHTITSGAGDIKGKIVSKRAYRLHRKRSPEAGLANTTAVDLRTPTTSGQDIRSVTTELTRRSSQLPPTEGLVFVFPPAVHTHAPRLPAMNRNDPELHRLSLTLNAPGNHPVSEYEGWLLTAKDAALTYTDGGQELDRLLCDLRGQFRALQYRKIEEWQRQQGGIHLRKRLKDFSNLFPRLAGCALVETDAFFGGSPLAIEPLTLVCYVLMAILHLMCGISLDDCGFFLPCVEAIVRMSGQNPDPASGSLWRLPRDPRTALNELKLKPDVQKFICCPKCFALYPSDGEVSDFCSFRETIASEPCNELLTHIKTVGNVTKRAAVREYFHQSLKVWLGKLLCRPGIEQLLDRDVFSGDSDNPYMDIFSGDALRHFCDRDGSTFLPSRPSEGRYIFGLSVDAFNPFLNKQAGKKASSSAIYMVLLNLPPSVRYKVENMYLAGIIPGPREPSLTQINHLLRPLVNELLELWDHGIWYTSTPYFASGKLVRAALVPLICDLKAARQVMGHGSHSAKKFCSICNLCWDRRNEIAENSRVAVPMDQFREYALDWKLARSRSERDKLFKKHGIRWSVLLDLPYWDPPRYTIVDSMHTILLGHIHRHCSIIWGMNATRVDAGGNRKGAGHSTKRPGSQAITTAAWTIRSGPMAEIMSLRASLLREFCLENGLLSHDLASRFNALEMQDLILKHRVERGWFAQTDQDRPIGALDFLCKVDSVPRSVIRETEAHFGSGASPKEIMSAIGNTRKVVLSALYAQALRRIDTPKPRTAELVKGTEANSVKRLDIVARISEIHEMGGGGDYGSEQPGRLEQEDIDEGVILCEDTLSLIRLDMKRTVLPSEISPVPREVGSPSAGKLTADQWRTFCTVHLVVSLIRLWGKERPDSRRAKILDNFLHLVTFTNSLHMRQMTPERIKFIEEEILTYLEGLRALYPQFSLVPKHHMALHLPAMLRDFGPVHAWRTFAFERLNQIFQNVSTNSLLGQLEHTILNRFCMMQGLHGLIPLLPDGSQQLIEAFAHRFKPRRVGTLMSDTLAMGTPSNNHDRSSPKDLDQETKGLLRGWRRRQSSYSRISTPSQANHLKKFEHRGMELKPMGVSSRDSLVVIGDDACWRAARLEALFSIKLYLSGVEKRHILAKVIYFSELSGEDSSHDPYRRFRNTGRIFYAEDKRAAKGVVSVDEILCRFAMTHGVCSDTISSGHVHVLPLT